MASSHLFGSMKDASLPGNGFASRLDGELAKVEVTSDIAPGRTSEKRREVVRAMCVAYTRLEQVKRAEWWCEELLGFRDNAEGVDELVGCGEVLMAEEEWEEAVRTLEKAFEASERSSQDVSRNPCLLFPRNMADAFLHVGNEGTTENPSAP